MQPNQESVYEAALRYWEAGLSVLPIRADGSKAPALPEWKSYQTRLPREDELKDWFGTNRPIGLAIVTGEVSGWTEVIDFDDAALFDVWSKMVREEALEIGQKLVIAQSPRPGFQCWYRCTDPVPGGKKLAMGMRPDPNDLDSNGQPKNKKKTLIETRGQGNYALIPPTPACCHEKHRPYQLLRGDFAHLPVLSQAERRLLIAFAQALTEMEVEEPDAPPRKRLEPRELLGDDHRPGTLYNQRGDWSELLTRHGWRMVRDRGGIQDWCRPGKERGISATLNAVGDGWFYVFSSNTSPFEPEQSYNLFSAYALLECGGDYRAAARALAAEGYGHQEALAPSVSVPGIPHEETAEGKPLFPLLDIHELLALAPPQDQVERFFEVQTFVVLFGASSNGKSLLVLDLAMHTVKGSPRWFDRRLLKHGNVVWVNADGGRGLQKRVKAWLNTHGSEVRYRLRTRMGLVPLNRGAAMRAFIDQIKDEEPVLVVFDTMSACIPGADENLQSEMTRVTSWCHQIQIETGATVMMLHHTNAAGLRERGSGIPRNESDAMMRLTLDEPTNIISVHCEKNREGRKWPDFYAKIEPAHGSVIVVPSGSPGEVKQRAWDDRRVTL